MQMTMRERRAFQLGVQVGMLEALTRTEPQFQADRQHIQRHHDQLEAFPSLKKRIAEENTRAKNGGFIMSPFIQAHGAQSARFYGPGGSSVLIPLDETVTDFAEIEQHFLAQVLKDTGLSLEEFHALTPEEQSRRIYGEPPPADTGPGDIWLEGPL